MKFHCAICDTYFDQPLELVHQDPRPDGLAETFREELCPICCQPYIELGDTCPQCGGDMPKGDLLCPECRKGLLPRLLAFADSLTLAEAGQVDDWLDGRSITDREAFQ